MNLAQHGKTTPTRKNSRITRGTKLLPNVHKNSHWARIMGDVYNSVVSHCGGDGYISELQRLQARRIAAMEAECTYLEDRIAQARKAGEEPPNSVVDLYLRAAAAQRRHAEVLGWRPQQRDITPDLRSYIEGKSKEVAGGAPERPTAHVDIEHIPGFQNPPESEVHNPPESEIPDSPVSDISESEGSA